MISSSITGEHLPLRSASASSRPQGENPPAHRRLVVNFFTFALADPSSCLRSHRPWRLAQCSVRSDRVFAAAAASGGVVRFGPSLGKHGRASSLFVANQARGKEGVARRGPRGIVLTSIRPMYLLPVVRALCVPPCPRIMLTPNDETPRQQGDDGDGRRRTAPGCWLSLLPSVRDQINGMNADLVAVFPMDDDGGGGGDGGGDGNGDWRNGPIHHTNPSRINPPCHPLLARNPVEKDPAGGMPSMRGSALFPCFLVSRPCPRVLETLSTAGRHFAPGAIFCTCARGFALVQNNFFARAQGVLH
jgi:hypothetical protein